MKKFLIVALVLGGLAYWWFGHESWAQDDPMERGLTTADFPQIPIDLFPEMDGGKQLTPEQIMGRNSWNAWTAGTQDFWHLVSTESFGLTDLLKTIDSRQRGERFSEMGLISEPGFAKASAPDELGLWLDQRVEPEVEGWNTEWERIYGRSSGVMGLRLYPNPEFFDSEEAQEDWDGKRYYTDRDYYTDPRLVRPYKVGMTCGFCHIAFDPLSPPEDPEQPAWENLMSTIGNQWIREGPVFMPALEPGSFLYEMLEQQPPGTSDTSRVATDHINNPNMINGIFNLEARLGEAVEEQMSPGRPHLAGPSFGIFGAEKEVMAKVPHVLKDGADSVGVPGATIRVYVNIGMFSEYWLQLHNKLVGLGDQQPFEIEHARKSSVYWQATEERLANIAAFLKTARPLHLADAPGSEAFLSDDEDLLRQGGMVFANECAECHSSKQPPADVDRDSPEGERWYEQSVLAEDFRVDNFLSNDQRYPVTRRGLGTNASRAMGTNATLGNIWDNFSSQTYKDLEPVGMIECYDPSNPDVPYKWEAPGGGRGYYRPPSLISLWSSAPFLHNNALGIYTGDPSVAGRMTAFNDACEKLLWPEKRLGVGSVWVTQQESWLKIPDTVLPPRTKKILKKAGLLSDDTLLEIGPIPAGTPVNLLGSLDPNVDKLGDIKDLAQLAIKIKTTLARVHLEDMDPDEQRALMREELVPILLDASRCPDFVEDKGHTFGKQLTDDDKRALIEFLKTL